MTNRDVAGILAKIADLLEIKEENIYKIRAYRKAANSILNLDENIVDLYRMDSIGSIPGVGEAVKTKIEELIEKGTCEYYEKLLEEIPAGVLDMLSVPGIGHKTVKLIYEKLGIENLTELSKAVEEKKIRTLPGLGVKTEEKIRRGIEFLNKNAGQILLGVALPLAEEFKNYLLEADAVQDACVVGSIRRGKPLVRDIDVLVASTTCEGIYERVVAYRNVKTITSKTSNHIKGQFSGNIDFEVMIVDPRDYAYFLVWTTGSREHREMLFKNISKNDLRGCKNEAEIFRKLGLQYIPPELRENRGEIKAAYKHEIPKLLDLDDLRGDLHIHSDWSDGAHSIQDLAVAARKLNYSYIAVTDHSKSLFISGGLTEERLLAQGEVIDHINSVLKDFRILKGIEVDILKDGTLDFSDEILEKLDIVVASVHSSFNLDRETQTQRIVKAMENKHVDIVGHLTGRLLNRRSAYELDIDKILETAAKNKVVLEINSHPDRLDIDEFIARRVKEYGIKVAINSDAHHKGDLHFVRYGVLNARRGWLEREDVVNTWSLEELLSYFE